MRLDWGIRARVMLAAVLPMLVIAVVLTLSYASSRLADFDHEVEEAAYTLGADRSQTIRRVILPALLPAILTGYALAFARAVGEYGSVIFIAGNIPMKSEILPLVIVKQLEQFKYADAAAVGVIMLALSFVLLLAIGLLQRWSRRWAER